MREGEYPIPTFRRREVRINDGHSFREVHPVVDVVSLNRDELRHHRLPVAEVDEDVDVLHIGECILVSDHEQAARRNTAFRTGLVERLCVDFIRSGWTFALRNLDWHASSRRFCYVRTGRKALELRDALRIGSNGLAGEADRYSDGAVHRDAAGSVARVAGQHVGLDSDAILGRCSTATHQAVAYGGKY